MSKSPRAQIPLSELARMVGAEIGVSGWRVVSQDMIDRFADVTDDHQFIHCDPERAKRESGISRFRVWSFGPSRNDEEAHAEAPCAFGRRRCSSSRGRISTKLHGRVR